MGSCTAKDALLSLSYVAGVSRKVDSPLSVVLLWKEGVRSWMRSMKERTSVH